MKFAHLADIHIGSWRDAQLRDISLEVFCAAIDRCMESAVDFVVLAGDLFNTSMPTVDQLRTVTAKLHQLHVKNIPCYIIPGSHDYSPAGKTMIDVLEAADLVCNVMRGDVRDGNVHLRMTVDKKTGAKLTGIIGKKGMLDRQYYEHLACEELEREEGFKIFLWHTAIEEFKPKGLEKMEAVPISFFPKKFPYYAGGHVHVRLDRHVDGYGRFTLPGSLFPVNFDELEEYSHGGMYLYDDSNEEPLQWMPIQRYPTIHLRFDCDGKNPAQIHEEFESTIAGKTFASALVTMRFEGMLSHGTIAEMDFHKMTATLYGKGAKAVVKNTLHLSVKQFEEIKVSYSTIEALEHNLVQEHAMQIDIGLDKESSSALALALMEAFGVQKIQGENNEEFERRLSEGCLLVLGKHKGL